MYLNTDTSSIFQYQYFWKIKRKYRIIPKIKCNSTPLLMAVMFQICIVWFSIKVTTLNSKFSMVYSSQKIFYFFTCILLDYLAHEITKEFWKNIHFENMTAAFLLRCQNWPRWEISLLCHWNIDSWKQKMSLGHVMVPKNDQNII